MADLIGISQYKAAVNLPGLSKIEYAPVDWIDSFEELVNANHELTQQITFTFGNNWLTAPVFPIQQNWNEGQQSDQQGSPYSQQVTAIVPNLRPAVSGEFQKMKDRPFIIKLADRHGTDWIIGTLESGLLFKAPSKTGSAGGTEMNDYRIEWSGLTANRAYGYAPVL